MNLFQQVESLINAELQVIAEALREEVVDAQYQEYLEDQDAMYEEMYSRYQWEDEIDNFPYG
jgi:hypothetical protein